MNNCGRLIPRSSYLATLLLISIAAALPPTEHSAQKSSPLIQVTIRTAVAAWSISDDSAVESDSGNSAVILTVEISDCSNETVKVDYTTSPGTATPGVDYQETSGTLTFPGPNPCPPETVPGSQVISVIALGDTEPEPNETIIVTLSNAKNATIADGKAIALILDDDSPFGFHDVSVESGIANNNIQTTGVQWIDYNRDKRLDLYLVGKNGNALFKNLGNGTFKNVTKTTKTSNNGKDARGASWADIDNDGDPDLFIANASGSATLLENRKGRFVDISGNISGLSSSGVGLRVGGLWLDINNDSNIDLFQVFEGGPNILAKNTGSKKLVNVTSSAGVLHSGTGRAAVSADFNNDEYQDIYLVNYHEPNRLYINNKNETFTEMASSAGLDDSGGFTQVMVSDYDKDEDFDIFVVNNEGSSILYRNEGNLKFKSAAPAIIKRQKEGIAAAFHDFDGDKDEDLVLVQTSGKKNLLFVNDGGTFKIKKGIDLSNPDKPTGIAIGDFNEDGFPDIAIGDGDAAQENGDSLLENIGGSGNHTLTVVLEGKQSQRDGIGSTVVVQTGFSEFQRKTMQAGNDGFALTFGLGQNLEVDFLRIFWPSGLQTLQHVNATDGKPLTVIESLD